MNLGTNPRLAKVLKLYINIYLHNELNTIFGMHIYTHTYI